MYYLLFTGNYYFIFRHLFLWWVKLLIFIFFSFINQLKLNFLLQVIFIFMCNILSYCVNFKYMYNWHVFHFIEYWIFLLIMTHSPFGSKTDVPRDVRNSKVRKQDKFGNKVQISKGSKSGVMPQCQWRVSLYIVILQNVV